MPYVDPGIDSDQLATLLANPGRAAALTQAMQAAGLGNPAVMPPGTNPTAVPQPDPTLTPAPAPNLWESGLTASPSGSSAPQPVASPNPNDPAYGAPADLTTRPVRPPAASIDNPMPPAPWMVGASSPPAGAPTLPGSSPLDSVIAARPTPNMTAQDQLAADMARRTGALSDKGNQPRWWERMLAGAAAGAVMYGSHNPEAAAEAGANITGRRMSNALRPIDASIAADQSGVTQNQSDFENKRQSWEDALKGVTEQRQESSAEALQTERAAKADKYDNAIDPKSLRQDTDGKWIGTTYGGKDVPAADPTAGKVPKLPGSPFAAHMANWNATHPGVPPPDDKVSQWQRESAQATHITIPKQANEYEDWKAQFTAENGRPPTAQEIIGRRTAASTSTGYDKATKNKLTSLETLKNSQLHDLEKTYTWDPKSNQYVNRKNNADTMAPEDWRQQRQTIQNNYEAERGVATGEDQGHVELDAQGNWPKGAPQQAAATVSQSPTAQPALPARGANRTATSAPQRSSAWSAPPDAPPAPKEDGHKLTKDGKTILAISKGGQWAQP